MIWYEEAWKNRLNNKRQGIIKLINRLFDMATEKNYKEIELEYMRIIGRLGR